MILEIMAGTTIDEAARKMCIAASDSGETVEADFNGTTLIAYVGSTYYDIVKRYDDACKKRVADYKASHDRRLKNEKVMKEKFWMVWNENGNQPRHKHTFRHFADEEAARLAREHRGQTFIVLESMCEVVSSDVIVTKHTDPLPF